MRTLNLGILAHVDAGKTSLTERLLFAAGVIDEIGSVDDGNTQTDSLALERQRGITIKSAVVSFVIDDVRVNLIDTPGHPDFIAEVERVLSVLDGAVLVVSAVEGVQSQTRVLMRALQRLRIPTLVFVNKIDRGGANYGPVLQGISEKLTPSIIAMGKTLGLGTRESDFIPYGSDDVSFKARLTEVLADHDDAFLAAYVDDETRLSDQRLRRELAVQTGKALVHPVFFGSAVTGAGVDALISGVKELLPAARGDIDGPVSGAVFKVERGPAGEKIAYVRMFSGTVRTRDRLREPNGKGRGGHAGREGREGRDGKVTAISVFDRGSAVRSGSVSAGEIAKVWGLGHIQIGDVIGSPEGSETSECGFFAPPTLETVILPTRPSEKGALHVALTQLSEQDPLINVRQNDIRQEIFVSLYGEVQKEVIAATLANDFGIEVEFRETTTICIERPIGIGAAVEILKKDENPFLATVGLRIEPAPIDAGVEFRLGIERGSLPPAFLEAVETTVKETLQQGLYGWQVADCTVIMTHSGYLARQSRPHQGFDKSMSSTAGDFRNVTPLVLLNALKQAGTGAYEPMHRFRLEVPADTFGAILPVLVGLRAVPETQQMQGSTTTLEGDIPAARVHELRLQLPALARGEGVLESTFDHYQLVRGAIPTRARTDHNPLNRKEYLRHVMPGV